jgi:hypothetical protein
VIKYYKVLAGEAGSRVSDFLSNSYFGIDYDVNLDLTSRSYSDLEDFRKYLTSKNSEYNKSANKLWRLLNEIQIGDILLLFVREDKSFRIGVVESDYFYQEGVYPHRRRVNWGIHKPLQKERMSVGLQNSATGPTAIANLDKRSAELSHLVFGTPWTPEDSDEEYVAEEESKELTEVAAGELSTHHIYVYTYNHYILHPVRGKDESTPIARTYYKIGMTTKGYDSRVYNQETTALPEPIILVRAYKLSEKEESLENRFKDSLIKEKEYTFHTMLESAGHTYNKKRSKQGKEWFLTNLSFLDMVAELLGMQQISVD